MARILAIISLYGLVFSLTLLPNLEGKESTLLENGAHRRRTERDVNTPAKIACQVSAWGQWSTCQPCVGHRYRSRNIVQFGQFGGRTCRDVLSDEEACPISGNCEAPPVNCGSNFQCDNGRCVNRRLRCNDDNDCADYSDEDNCESYNSPCRKFLEPLEIARTAGSGVNIFGLEPRRSAFNNEFYNGQCDRVYDGLRRTYFRLPWNVMSFIYQTRVEGSFTTEVYESSSEVATRLVDEFTYNLNGGSSPRVLSSWRVNLRGQVGINANISVSLETLLRLNMSQSYEYLRVKGQIQLAKFQMRRNRFELDEAFITDLKNLPTQYDKGVYFKILDDYGTHYASSGTLGGDYQLVYVLDKSEMIKEDITNEHVKLCLGFYGDINLYRPTDIPGISHRHTFNVNANINADLCHKITKRSASVKTEKTLIKGVLSFVNGGDAVFFTRLNAMLSDRNQPIKASLYTDWASSLIHSPAMVRQQRVPIYQLVPSTMRAALVIRQHLERAISDYEAEYSVCKCAPCMNGGTVLQLDGQCRCLCGTNFQGVACETPKQLEKGKTGYTDGQWSCWSDWSSCANNQRVRTRQCVGRQGEGTTCQGENQSTDYC
ncbi:complement component C9 isoform X1 [Scyliorhinus torazame]